jgi:hypothetical protein
MYSNYSLDLEDIYERAYMFSYIPGDVSNISISKFKKIFPGAELQPLKFEMEDVQSIASLLISRYNDTLKTAWPTNNKNAMQFPPYYDVCLLISSNAPAALDIIIDTMIAAKTYTTPQTFDAVDISDSWHKPNEITHLLFGRSNAIHLLNKILGLISTKLVRNRIPQDGYQFSWHGFYPSGYPTHQYQSMADFAQAACTEQDLMLSHHNIANLFETKTETVFSMREGTQISHNTGMIARIMNIDFE